MRRDVYLIAEPTSLRKRRENEFPIDRSIQEEISLTLLFTLSFKTSIHPSAAFNQKNPTVACSLEDVRFFCTLHHRCGIDLLLVGQHHWNGTVESHGILNIVFEDIQIEQTIRISITRAERPMRVKEKNRSGLLSRSERKCVGMFRNSIHIFKVQKIDINPDR